MYQNAEYMTRTYLPGIFVSQFLWRHHFRQLLFYERRFLPFLEHTDDQSFYEVGTGTGFFTLQVLRRAERGHAFGIDISPSSRRFTAEHLRAWGFEGRFTLLDVDVTTAELEPLDGLQCIEVLEHFADPPRVLRAMRRLLQPGGYGFISAALTAPNPDHIYLYWEPDEVVEHLEAAGFTVVDQSVEGAYPERPGEPPVPRIASFVVS